MEAYALDKSPRLVTLGKNLIFASNNPPLGSSRHGLICGGREGSGRFNVWRPNSCEGGLCFNVSQRQAFAGGIATLAGRWEAGLPLTRRRA
jgi:hypothetical protein